MNAPETPSPPLYQISENSEGGITLHIHGNMDSANAGQTIDELTSLLSGYSLSSLTVDLEKVDHLDDFGTLVLVHLRKMVTNGRDGFHVINSSDKIKELLSILHFDSLDEKISLEKKRSSGVFIRIGEATFRHISDLKYAISFIGSIILSLVHICLHPKSLRPDDTLRYMQRVGGHGWNIF